MRTARLDHRQPADKGRRFVGRNATPLRAAGGYPVKPAAASTPAPGQARRGFLETSMTDAEREMVRSTALRDQAWEKAKRYMDALKRLADTGRPECYRDEIAVRIAAHLVLGEIGIRKYD